MNPKRVVDQLLAGPEGHHWKTAMQCEIDSQRSKGTWKLVDRPKDAKVIDGMWVMKRKNENGETRFKARFVAKGFRQKYGVDYTDTFAPVIRTSSIRFLLSHALNKDMHIHHVDVKTAYLNSDLDETIFMQQPYMFETGEGKVCKLEKAIYGLKQSARCWHERLTQVLHNIGFEQFLSETCVFSNTSRSTIIGFYVDDLLIISKCEDKIRTVKRELTTNFDITDKGRLCHFLGITVDRNKNELRMRQTKFIDDLLADHEMTDCKGVATPLPAGTVIRHYDDSAPLQDKTTYQSIVGSLIYLSNASRPDIQFATGQLCKHMQSTTESPMEIEPMEIESRFN
jgi:hypothetical protein